MLVLLVLCTLFTGCVASTVSAREGARVQIRAAIAGEAQLDPSRFPARSLAVLPFETEPGDTVGLAFGWALTELLAQDLASTGRVDVVERLRLDALLAELELAESGRVDSVQAPRLGRLIGARRVTAGRLERGEDSLSYRLSLRVVDVASGTVSARASLSVSAAAFDEAERALLRATLGSLGLSVADAARVTLGVPSAVPADVVLEFGRGIGARVAGNITAATSALQQVRERAPDFLTATGALASVAQQTELVALQGSSNDRRRNLRRAARIIAPGVPVRDAEAVDVAAGGVVGRTAITIEVIVP